jgi:hypothetical protein
VISNTLDKVPIAHVVDLFEVLHRLRIMARDDSSLTIFSANDRNNPAIVSVFPCLDYPCVGKNQRATVGKSKRHGHVLLFAAAEFFSRLFPWLPI